ncbi:response regulator transcription factor [Sinorhizobium fredii]|uniref:Two-component response regulator protein n=1 Tax=Sinorhizobium fredii (strain HH103) TaxID=1117943 RepID=G9AFJ6_SINF1|nr:response regulator transcription factor [Sinorhizobium fredii]MCG5473374.1 response regulator transcription factor [Sinorhizobium fredii]MQW96248.1 DNA-binding response regulator [Sinorhizobium fredii]UTY45901.1 response regulator transcription factor [Sinorhizobium fredii]CCE99828.1 putative two-component response regulator protein [Sinorhizobium fredii HH103]
MNSESPRDGGDPQAKPAHEDAGDEPRTTETEARPLQERHLVIIDGRALWRDSLARNIAADNPDEPILTFESSEEWRRQREEGTPPSAILLNIADRKVDDPAVEEEITILASEFAPVPVIVLADREDLTQIVKALECGAKGYIPSSVSVDVCIEAISLSLAGGIFVPARSVFAMRHLFETGDVAERPLAGLFTDRQAEVVEALRRGKANKVIAYELNLRESTVKVHVRNIMKKIKAANRTEVAYKIYDLFPDHPPAPEPNRTNTRDPGSDNRD